MRERKYLPTLAELIDRLSIAQLKEVKIPYDYFDEIMNNQQILISYIKNLHI